MVLDSEPFVIITFSFLPIFVPSLLIGTCLNSLSNIVIPSRWSISCWTHTHSNASFTSLLSAEKEFIFPEGCLSFPNKKVRTKRNISVKVKADNHESTLSFSADSKEVNDAFECVCVQHEIDHLDGVTMFDREFKQVPIKRVGRKIGRNDKVMITKGSESKTLKYKKAEPMLEDGWVLSN